MLNDPIKVLFCPERNLTISSLRSSRNVRQLSKSCNTTTFLMVLLVVVVYSLYFPIAFAMYNGISV